MLEVKVISKYSVEIVRKTSNFFTYYSRNHIYILLIFSSKKQAVDITIKTVG